MSAVRTPRGITLIDILVGIAVIAIVFTGIFGAFQLAVKVVTASKGEAGANALVNSQMEYIRSLSYADVGTQGGSPAGVLAASSTQKPDQTEYVVQTSVRFVDDSADGIGLSDQNSNPNDYKMVTVTVSWQEPGGARSVSAVSYVTPPGIEGQN